MSSARQLRRLARQLSAVLNRAIAQSLCCSHQLMATAICALALLLTTASVDDNVVGTGVGSKLLREDALSRVWELTLQPGESR
jgi:hypothetical protein